MKCENCNREYDGSYGSGRFCSVKCARGFSTKGKRKEINEKVSKTLCGYKFINNKKTKVSKKRCINCNKVIYGKTKKYCDDCRIYSWRINLFKKLGLYKKNQRLEEINSKSLNFLFDLYFNKKYSTNKISKIFGVNQNTIG